MTTSFDLHPASFWLIPGPRHRAPGPAQPVHTLARHDHRGLFAAGCPWCQPRTYASDRARHRKEETR